MRPGSALEIRRFEVPAAGEKIDVSTEDQKAMLKEALGSAVRRRVGAASGRSGVLLSGGIDSALLAAQAAALSDNQLASFTFSYGDYEGLLNEDPRSSKVAAHLGTDHSRLEYGPAEIADNLDDMLAVVGEPFSYGLHTYVARRLGGQGMSDLLSGAGADVCFPGRIEVLAQRLRWMHPLIGMTGGAVLPLLARVPGGAARRLHRLVDITVTEIPIDYRNTMTPLETRRALYADPGRAAAGDRATRDLFGRAMAPFAGRPLLDRWVLAEDAFSGDGLTFCPLRWAWLGGSSIRFPYRDRAFVDTILRLPQRSGDKRELRRVGMDYMPRDLANVPKVFQSVPVEQWFRGPLAEFLQDRLSPARLRESALFDGPVVEGLLKSHLQGNGVHTWTLWGILVLLAWQDVVNQIARSSIADAKIGSFG